MALNVNGKVVETDEEGYLLDPNDWDEAVAEALAEKEGVKLDNVRWGLIRYFRDYYEDHMVHPTMHKLVKTLGKAHGDHYEEEKEYEKFLYQEFPINPIAEIAKLAGLPKPVVEAELES